MSDKCQQRVLFMRKRLMGNYELALGLVSKCLPYVNTVCAPGRFPSTAREGVVIACLMSLIANGTHEADTTFDGCKQEVCCAIVKQTLGEVLALT